MATIFTARSTLPNVVYNFLKPRIEFVRVPNRGSVIRNPPPKKKYPPWLPKQNRVLHREDITAQNAKFVRETIESKFGLSKIGLGTPAHDSPLKIPPIEPRAVQTEGSRRTGLIAKKIGIYPMWLKNGKKVLATLLQVTDNHVIKYIPPEDFHPPLGGHRRPKRRMGCLVVGAESTDPWKFTKEYCGMFSDVGLMPKKLLTRFMISEDAALQPGTPLYAAHFEPGTYIDIRGKTVDRGFQGVMKRWGFHGQPATHGQTKTHRRPGNIGSGGTKARVMPGTKLPGHMGNRYRILRGVKILRVNTKYNVMWVLAQNLPGETNNFLHIYDTILPTKKLKDLTNFPTYVPSPDETLPEELYADDVHQFTAPSIVFEPDA